MKGWTLNSYFHAYKTYKAHASSNDTIGYSNSVMTHKLKVQCHASSRYIVKFGKPTLGTLKPNSSCIPLQSHRIVLIHSQGCTHPNTMKHWHKPWHTTCQAPKSRITPRQGSSISQPLGSTLVSKHQERAPRRTAGEKIRVAPLCTGWGARSIRGT